MKYSRIYIPIFILVIFASFMSSSETDKRPSFAVMAYYVPELDYRPEQLPLEQLTHIIFSFTKVIDGEMKFKNEETGRKLSQLVAQRKNHPHLKVMIACGGWGADGFSDMSHTAENRKKFVQSVVEFNKKYELDGIDIDWEYPAIPAAGTGARPEDKQNFTSLMKELREALDGLDREQTLTFASAGWKPYYKNIEIGEVMRYANYMNVMTYDQIGSNSPFTGHHTALGWIKEKDVQNTPAWKYVEERRKTSDKDRDAYEPQSAEKIVAYCMDKGVKKEQIIIGAAFYGRAWKGAHPENNGLYQMNSGAHIGWSTYKQIRKEFEPNEDYKRYWDPIAKAPYIYNAKDSIFISYDDSVSVRLKTEYAMKKKLGGIMFWQLGNDTKEKNSLLKSIYDASTKK
ncbi:glycoside hydrolase family 18 protein [Flagellimonas onchidii]|uniref:glycoside hydrolase family 18 protein n=1 Tax=Flagellimonas onchidii TaxID=2562684 RepID=UPI0010A69D28|nr:glycoside hydrolase family 18 protein [Allomuricauda onchidii]